MRKSKEGREDEDSKEGRKRRELVGGEVEIICHVENYSYY